MAKELVVKRTIVEAGNRRYSELGKSIVLPRTELLCKLFHGGNTGSNPVGVANLFNDLEDWL